MKNRKKLTDHLESVVVGSYPVGVAECWRVDIQFYDIEDFEKVLTFGGKRNFTEYQVWVTGEYLEDFASLSADQESAEEYALQYISRRFEEARDENGDRMLSIILENQVYCHGSSCERGKAWEPPLSS